MSSSKAKFTELSVIYDEHIWNKWNQYYDIAYSWNEINI